MYNKCKLLIPVSYLVFRNLFSKWTNLFMDDRKLIQVWEVALKIQNISLK